MKGEQWFYKLVNDSPKKDTFSHFGSKLMYVLYIIQFYLQYIFIIIKKNIKSYHYT